MQREHTYKKQQLSVWLLSQDHPQSGQLSQSSVDNRKSIAATTRNLWYQTNDDNRSC